LNSTFNADLELMQHLQRPRKRQQTIRSRRSLRVENKPVNRCENSQTKLSLSRTCRWARSRTR